MADRTVKVTITAAVQGYLAAMDQVQKKNKSTSDDAKLNAEAQGRAFGELGAMGMRAGVVMAAGIALAVARFAEFDQAMSQVKAATQETAENMALLREAALDAGAKTAFTATEAANAIEELGKAGLTTEEILSGGLSGALVLAAAGGIGVAEAASYASITMKQFGLQGADAAHVADLLAAGAGKAVGDVSDLAMALNQAGLIANGAGFSIEETTGVLAAFADAGLLGSDAGTSLKTAIIALQAPSGAARKEMERLKLSFYDSNQQMLGFDEIAGQLETRLGGLSDEQRNSSLAIIFGTDAIRSANVLYTQGAEGIQKYIDQTNDAGYAAKVAADRLDNLAGDIEKLGGSFDTALIRSGSSANDVLRSLVQTLTLVVDGVGALPQPVLGLGLVLGTVTAAMLLTGGAALTLVPKFTALRATVAATGVSMGSFALRTAAVGGALGVALVAVSLFAGKQAEAAGTTQELTDSLDQSTGALTAYSREIVAKKLAEAGAFDAAREAGISQRELTDAVLEGGDALDAVKSKLAGNNTFVSFFDFTESGGIAAGNASSAIKSLGDSVERSGENFKNQAAAAESSVSSTEDASEAYLAAAGEVSGLSGELSKLIETINKANGIGQDAVTSNAAYQASLVDARKEIDAFAAANGVSSKNLDESTVAGSKNASTLAGLARQSQDAAKAQFDLDHSTEGYTDRLQAGRKEIYQTALALTGNAKAAQALTDKIYAMPSQKEIDILADTQRAENELRRLTSRWQGKTIKLRATVDDKLGSGILGKANGGILPGAPSKKDNMLIAGASGEFVTNSTATSDPANRAALEYMNAGGSIAAYASPAAPMYAGRGGGSSSVVITVPVTIKSLAVDNPDLLARTVTTSVKEALRNGVVPTDWNNA